MNSNTLAIKASPNRCNLQSAFCTLHLITGLFAVLILSGCGSTKVTHQDRLVYERMPRPNRIVVYDFSANPADVVRDSSLFGSQPTAQPTAEQAAIGRELGSTVARELAVAINEMGITAVREVQEVTPQINDIVIRGYLVSIDPGNAAKRMTIGFGAGGSELTTLVEGYQMTPQGLRKVGSATLDSKGNKGPGAALGGAGWIITGSPVGLAVSGGMKIYGEASGSATVQGRAKKTAREIADKLKSRFKEEGWIQ